MSFLYRDKVLADGPAAFWPMTAPTGPQVDLVAGIQAVPTSVPSGTRESPLPYYPSTVYFNGNAFHYVVSAADAAGITWLGGDYTAEMWAYSVINGADALISSRGSTTDAATQGFNLFAGSNGTGILVSDFGTSGTRISHPLFNMPVDTWVHIAMTYEPRAGLNDGIRRLYINGELVHSVVKNQTVPTIVPNMTIGVLGGNSSYAWHGMLNSVAVYHKRLTTEQIAAHYAARIYHDRGNLAYSTGAAWKEAPLKRWNGYEWAYKPLKRWDGSQWIPA